MGVEVWTAGASLAGVVVGGVTSFVGQTVQRTAAERAEERRRSCDLMETRRAERITHLIGFIAVAQEAERVAVDRYHHGHDDERWQARAREIEDRIWAAQKTIHLLCRPAVNAAARELAFALQDVIRNGPSDPEHPQDEKVWEHIRKPRRAFLDAAADDLASAAVAG
ncbi:hypothetical protein ACTOB_004744 [Actinoplanes oblitus]|uniref:Uncharacterized protein n=1 Tax=Actinoplanes oblitus TaxID=3040509 RepID=A0ABY8W8S8_9ACTN|nr:hypothetical protein [Actinoplanes oblitus]WIM92789.1 hypothetical protein ACTOB_004744 [Actinoplanes oblitus]